MWSIVKELSQSRMGEFFAKTAQPDYTIVLSFYQKFTHFPFPNYTHSPPKSVSERLVFQREGKP
jgi:hypothetical protein